MENQPTQVKKSNKMVVIIVAIVVVIGAGAGIYFATQGGDDTNTTTKTNTTAATNTATVTNTDSKADLYADLMKYDNKVVQITSADGKVKGQMAISIDLTEQYPITVMYFMKVIDTLPKSKAATGGGETYHYIAKHSPASSINEEGGASSFSATMCNKDQTPSVLAMAQARDISTDLYLGCDAQLDPWFTTDTFYHVYSYSLDNNTFDYDWITSKDTLAVFNSAPFYEEDPEDGGFGADNDAVITQSEPFITYSLIYTE